MLGALLVLTSGSLLGAMGLAQELPSGWEKMKDEFLGPSRTLLLQNCQRAAEANAQGLSAFNDAWVESIRTLRFRSGVSTDRPDGSNSFFAGLSAAMRDACPGRW